MSGRLACDLSGDGSRVRFSSTDRFDLDEELIFPSLLLLVDDPFDNLVAYRDVQDSAQDRSTGHRSRGYPHLLRQHRRVSSVTSSIRPSLRGRYLLPNGHRFQGPDPPSHQAAHYTRRKRLVSSSSSSLVAKNDTDRSLPFFSRNRTLNGGRAERNEYILLHEFHRLKYICPDTFKGKNKAALLKAEVDEDGTATKTAGGKREKFKGGLVFEPKRGLWDKYVLVMDFNSLYPSIIQEYNIDFTTLSVVTQTDVSFPLPFSLLRGIVLIEPARADVSSLTFLSFFQAEGSDTIPEVPSTDVPQGVLPRIIAQLVNRRREVKNLMKAKNSSAILMNQVRFLPLSLSPHREKRGR